MYKSQLSLADTPQQLGCMGLRGSEITLYGETPAEKDRMQPRSKVKTNGHFTTFMQVRKHPPESRRVNAFSFFEYR